MVIKSSLRWQTHKYTFCTTIALETKGSTAVMQKIELNIPAPAYLLPVDLIFGKRQFFSSRHDFNIHIDEPFGTIPGKFKQLICRILFTRTLVIIKDTADTPPLIIAVGIDKIIINTRRSLLRWVLTK